METKKRSILSILAMILVLTVSAGCLFGCGKKDDDDDDDENTSHRSGDKDDDDKDDDDKDDDDNKKDSYESIVDDYFKAIKEGDAEKIVSLFPEDYMDGLVENYYADDKDEYIEWQQEELDDLLEDLEDEDVDISKLKYKITDKNKFSKSEIKDLKEQLEEWYEVELDIKEAVTLFVDATAPVDGNKETTDMWLRVVKVDGSWYIISEYFDELHGLIPGYYDYEEEEAKEEEKAEEGEEAEGEEKAEGPAEESAW